MSTSDRPFAEWYDIIVWGCDWLSSQIPPENSTSAATIPQSPTAAADNIASPIPPATDSKDRPAEDMPHPPRATILVPFPSTVECTEVAPAPPSTPATAFPLLSRESDAVSRIAGTKRKADETIENCRRYKGSMLEAIREAERTHPAQPQAGPSRLIEANEDSEGSALKPNNHTTGASSFKEDFQAADSAPVNVRLWGQGPFPTQTSPVGQLAFSASTLSPPSTPLSSPSSGSSSSYAAQQSFQAGQMTFPSIPMPTSAATTLTAPLVSHPAPPSSYSATLSIPSVSMVNITLEMLLVARERAHLLPSTPVRNGQTPYNAGPFNCHICILGFRTKRELTTHERRQTHTKRVLVLNGYSMLPPKDFPCGYPECDKEYSNRSSLVTHRRTAHGIGEPVDATARKGGAKRHRR